MRVERCPTPEEFLDQSLGYRSLDPLGTNVMATVALGAAAEPSRYGECFWWLARDRRGQVSGAAFRTSPYMLGLGPMSEEAVRAITDRVIDDDAGLPGLIGRPHQVDSFAEAIAPRLDRTTTRLVVTRRDVLYSLDRLISPSTPGGAEVATETDVSLAESWLSAFAEEVDGARPSAPTDVARAQLLGVLRDQRLHWWRDGGEIVSMAGHNVTVHTPDASVTRVGPVFTPTEHRRRGYAAGLTAAVSALLLDQGSSVMLFADASNATSNSVYVSLGYRAVDTMVMAAIQTGERP